MAIHPAPIVLVVDPRIDRSFYDPTHDVLRFRVGAGPEAGDPSAALRGHAIPSARWRRPSATAGEAPAPLRDASSEHSSRAIVEVLAPGFGGGDAPAIAEAFSLLWERAVEDEEATAPGHAPHVPEHLAFEVRSDGAGLAAAIERAAADADLSREDTLRLAIEALAASPASTTYRAWAEAFVDADTVLFGGAHRASLERSLTWDGVLEVIAPAASFGDSDEHTVHSTAVDVSAPTPTPERGDVTTTLIQPGARAVRVHFDHLQLESSPSCPAGSCDRIYLYGSDRRLAAVLRGGDRFASVAIPGDRVLIRFVTDAGGFASLFHIDRLEYQP